MRNASILVVGAYPRASDLMETALRCGYPIQIQIARSPADAFVLIKQNQYPVISFDYTDTSTVNGIQFLGNVS